jgi:hypothetical protein
MPAFLAPIIAALRRVEFADSPAVERLINPELDDWVQGFGDVPVWPVIARVQGVPDFSQVINVVHH